MDGLSKIIIDVSYHNGPIDWIMVKTQVDGVVIRCGYGDDITTQDDKRFKEYVEACIKYDIPFGIYIYSYAKTETQVQSEIQHALRLIAPYKDKMSYPVYLDLEEPGTEAGALERAIAFGTALEKEGYFVGIYASEYWWNTYLVGLDRFTKWVAKYGKNNGELNTKPSVTGTDIWQYTSVGRIEGISGNVDVNVCYRDFPAEIRAAKVAPVQPTQTQIQEPTPVPAERTYAHSIGEHVVFSTCYGSSTDPTSKAIGVGAMARNHGVITKIVDAPNPYLLDNGLCWVNDGDIRGQYTESAINYYPTYTGNSVSIVDALNAIGVDSSKSNRTQIAAKNEIANYSGNSEENTKLLNLLKQGKLVM